MDHCRFLDDVYATSRVAETARTSNLKDAESWRVERHSQDSTTLGHSPVPTRADVTSDYKSFCAPCLERPTRPTSSRSILSESSANTDTLDHKVLPCAVPCASNAFNGLLPACIAQAVTSCCAAAAVKTASSVQLKTCATPKEDVERGSTQLASCFTRNTRLWGSRPSLGKN